MRLPQNLAALSIFMLLLPSNLLAAPGDPYIWPKYNPIINYNFKLEHPKLPMPTKNLDDCSGVVGTQSDGWWTFKWGARKNSLVTKKAITPMLKRFNEDFAYIRDTMGWPPDKRAQDGYRSAVYLFGSGLCTDNEPNTALGGWQSSVRGYPIVLASYYPVYSFDPSCTYNDRKSQMGAMIHEGIHCILASLPGCREAAWFHEGGNTWLQQEMDAQRSKNYNSMGFLNGAALIAPFMPIECYSGWLQDGSFGGPSAEGVNKHENGKQICTWRKFLGGTQYGNIFPTFLGVWVGYGAVPWIWKNCPSRVLEGMAAKLGEKQIRRLITEYRAKTALLDMGVWSTACKNLINASFKSSFGAEFEPYWIKCAPWIATPYAKTTNDGSGLLTPEKRTTPGWSGANQIPLKVNGSSVSIDFQPIGKSMSCQLVYRATDGSAVYGQPITSGTCSLRLDKPAANNVVIAVICNTDYIYNGEQTRTAHYDYRLKLGKGISGTADIYTRWYDVKMTTSINNESKKGSSKKTGLVSHLKVMPVANRNCLIAYSIDRAGQVSIELFNPTGSRIAVLQTGFRTVGKHTEVVAFPEVLTSAGTYIIQVKTEAQSTAGIFTVSQ